MTAANGFDQTGESALNRSPFSQVSLDLTDSCSRTLGN